MNDSWVHRIWYFAYGSNMQRATFCNRRGLDPAESVAGSLEGYRLRFDLPIGPGERGVANIIADPATVVCGVLHRITVDEAQRLDRTEGVHRGYYERVHVRPTLLDGRTAEAFTYRSRHGVEGRKPSARYMRLLLEGAAEHGLPSGYLDYLRRFELAVDEREAG